MIECQISMNATILAFEPIAEEHVEPGEGRTSAGFDERLQRNDARQRHRQIRAASRLIVFGNNVYAIKKHCLDRILPTPERQRVVAQWSVVSVQDQRRVGIGRYRDVQATLRVSSLEAKPDHGGSVYALSRYCEALP